MRNKFIRAAGEIVLFNLLALFLVYRLFIASRMEAAGSVDEKMCIRDSIFKLKENNYGKETV